MSYEIRAVKLVDDNYERCDENDPDAVWGFYEIDAEGLAFHLSDHETRSEAEAVLKHLQGEA